MPHSPSPSATPSSGIQTTTSGDRHIPQSVRADGSLRKEIKIRPGYRPPEDVEVYKNRTAEAWKTRGSAGVPGADGSKNSATVGEGTRGKNAKRREARKKARATDIDVNSDGENAEGKGTSNNGVGLALKDVAEDAQLAARPTRGLNSGDQSDITKAHEQLLDAEAEKEKQARNLKKKLRQAKELKEKKDCGESLLPEQFAKVIKINELIRQLDNLGFDGDGMKKPEHVA